MASMSSFLKSCLLFSLFIVIVSSACVQSSPDGSVELELLTTMAKSAILNHNMQKRAVDFMERHARALIPAEFSLATLGLFGTFKAVIIALGAMFAFSTFIPAVLGFLGISAPILPPIRSIPDSLNEVNYMVARSINELGSTIGKIQNKTYLLELEGEECRDRAICEVGKFLGQSYPSVSTWLKNLGGFDKLILGDQFSLAMVKGMRSQECQHLYPKCKRNPFHNWYEIAEKFR